MHSFNNLIKLFEYTMDYRVLKQLPNYEIYEDGTVWRKEHTTINGTHLKRMQIFPYIAKNKYLVVVLHDSKSNRVQKYLHRLVFEAFFGSIPRNYEVDHIDGDKNNCHVQNLRISTHRANCNNPSSIARYKAANSLCKGKFDRDKMIAAQGKEAYDMAYKTYLEQIRLYGSCGVWKLMKVAHVGYQRACKIVREANGMGASD